MLVPRELETRQADSAYGLLACCKCSQRLKPIAVAQPRAAAELAEQREQGQRDAHVGRNGRGAVEDVADVGAANISRLSNIGWYIQNDLALALQHRANGAKHLAPTAAPGARVRIDALPHAVALSGVGLSVHPRRVLRDADA